MDEVQHRKIIHVDMDAFFASVEQRDDPALRGVPTIVGGSPEGRGVVAACSYEARQFGIRSAMPAAEARRRCPSAVFIKPRFDVYREVSAALQSIFRRYTPLVEPLSLDEAYIDVTESTHCAGSASLIARQLKRDIFEETSLVASAGVAANKFLAKLACGMGKPNGLHVILPGEAEAVLATMEVRQFHGIGAATEKKMRALGVYTGADLKRLSERRLQQHFGSAGRYYYRIARGIDLRPVKPSRERKSLGAERTFAEDLVSRQAMLEQLFALATRLSSQLRERRLQARTITLKVRYSDFSQVTRSCTERCAFDSAELMCSRIAHLLDKTEAGQRSVRLLGLSLSALDERPLDVSAPEQYALI